jgi:hypothetical protein
MRQDGNFKTHAVNTCSEVSVIEKQPLLLIIKGFIQINEKEQHACIRHQCRKTTVLSCRKCLINSGVDKMNYI